MKRLKNLIKTLGPGFITGASDDDPSGIATYTQTGAQFGYAQLWTAVVAFPLMTSIQEMCGRIGLITGHGLAGVIKRHYTKPVLYSAVLLLLVANTINIGANLGAMAASAELLVDIPFPALLVLMTVFTLILEVFVSYKTYVKYLKYLTISLFAYIVTAFFIDIDWTTVFIATFTPHFEFTKDYLINLVAIFGTSISPYLFFWQANEEVEEEIAHHKLRRPGKGVPTVTPKDLSRLHVDTTMGMLFSQVVMWFIIVTAGATLYPNGIHNVASAAEAAAVLRPFAGDFAFLLFALGIIGTGLLAVPVLSGSASYAVSEAFGWNAGLYLKLKKAHGFYGVITIATLFGLLINFIGINPISALYYTAVINGIIAPFLIFMIIKIANNKKIMGEHVNNRTLNIFGIITLIIMTAAPVALLFYL